MHSIELWRSWIASVKAGYCTKCSSLDSRKSIQVSATIGRLPDLLLWASSQWLAVYGHLIRNVIEVKTRWYLINVHRCNNLSMISSRWNIVPDNSVIGLIKFCFKLSNLINYVINKYTLSNKSTSCYQDTIGGVDHTKNCQKRHLLGRHVTAKATGTRKTSVGTYTWVSSLW